MSIRKEQSVTRALLFAFCLAIVALHSSGSAQAVTRIIPAPGYANSIAALRGTRMVAVLAGTQRAKGVYLIDETNGNVVRSFSVGESATAVAEGATSNEILVAVDRNGSVGAVERWTSDGVRRAVIPLASGVKAVTGSGNGMAYALIEHGRDRAVVAIALPTGRLKGTFPLPATTASIGVCQTARGDVLVSSDTTYRHITLIRPGDRVPSVSPEYADVPVCEDGTAVIDALTGTLGARAVTRYTNPSVRPLASMPVDGYAYDLAVGEGTLLVLASNGPTSSIEIVPTRALR